MPLRALRHGLLATALAGGGGTALAQDVAAPQMQSTERFQTPFVTLDQDRLFLQSAFGRRLQEELESARAEAAAENRSIEADLTAEEQTLTEARDTVEPLEFARMAEAFDTKVQRIRSEQDRKSARLQERLDDQRAAFLSVVGPVLVELLQERGAVGIIDRNAVLLAFEGLDITEDAVELIDARLGDGAATTVDEGGTPVAPETPAPQP